MSAVATAPAECFNCKLPTPDDELVELRYHSEEDDMRVTMNRFCDQCVKSSMNKYEVYMNQVEDYGDAICTDVHVRIIKAMMWTHAKRVAKHIQEQEVDALHAEAIEAGTPFTYPSKEAREKRVGQIADKMLCKVVDDVDDANEHRR